MGGIALRLFYGNRIDIGGIFGGMTPDSRGSEHKILGKTNAWCENVQSLHPEVQVMDTGLGGL